MILNNIMEIFYLLQINQTDFSFAFNKKIISNLEKKYKYFENIYLFKCKDIEILKNKIRKYYVGIKFNGNIFEMNNKLLKVFLFNIEQYITKINYIHEQNTCDICQTTFKKYTYFLKHLDTQKHLLNYNKEINNMKNELTEIKKDINDLKIKIKNIKNIIAKKYKTN